MKKCVVIGGGIAGLATAALLAKGGMDVTLFEARERVGGRAYTFEKDGFLFDMGPSWYLMPEAFDQFFKLMGTSAEAELDLVKLDPAYQTRNEGSHEKLVIRADLAHNLATFESVEAGAGKKLQSYLNSAQETYELAFKHFLYTNFTNAKSFTNLEVLKKSANFVKHLLTSLDSFAAKHVKDSRLRKVLDFPAVFLGASPYKTPSMYHLMTHVDMNQGVFYPQGGFYTIIEAIERLAKKHGVKIHCGSPVTEIVVENGKAVGVKTGSVEHACDVVVGAADLHHLETKIVPLKSQTFPEKHWEKLEAGPSALLLFLGVKGQLPQLDHHTLLYSEDWKTNFDQVFKPADGKSTFPNPASLYICNPSKTDGSVAPADHENLFVLVPIAPDPSLGGRGDERFEAAADAVIDQIASWCDIPDLRERIVVRHSMGPKDFANELNAWNGTALGLAHTLKQSAFLRPSNRSKKLSNLFYAGHHTIPGIGLPMCLISAELVFKHLTNDKTSCPIAHEIGRVF